MSDTNDDNQNQPADKTADLIAKSEKLMQDNDRLSKQIEALTNMVQTSMQPKQTPAPVDEDDLEMLAYKDPKAYARKVKEQAAKEAEAIIDRRLQSQQASQQTIAQLAADYPELNDASSELTRKAVEFYAGLSESEKRSPTAYKIAVRDAAAELGLLPKSKRKSSSNDDFSFGGDGGGSSSSRRSGGNEGVDKATLEFAERMGLNIRDKKVVERIKTRAQRKNWNRYE